MQSLNNTLICTPFQGTHNKSVKVGRVDLLSNKTQLEPLKVLVQGLMLSPTGESLYILKAGDTVYVRGDTCKAPWSKPQTCEVLKTPEGEPVEFILVPFSECVLINQDGV